MYVRIVRFTGVSAERMQELVARIDDSGGPPEGINTMGIQVAFDEAQGTAVVTQRFPTAADMEAAAKILSAMDPADTPGTRATVDTCEVKLDLDA
jgi:hypothetical protein